MLQWVEPIVIYKLLANDDQYRLPIKDTVYCKSLDKSSDIPNLNNSTQLVQQLPLQLRCNDLDIYNKGINLYKRASIIVIFFMLIEM